jgi:ferredoxin-type protein NapG
MSGGIPADDDLFDETPVFTPPPPRRAPSTSLAPQRPVAAIRPPGALPPGRFEEACTRCGACVEACPPSAILVRGADPYPRLLPAETPCERCHDLPCVRRCPTGALGPIPLEALRIGVATVHARLCLNTGAPGACDHCLDQCPIPGALVAGPGGVPVVTPDRCVGCGLCARYCRAVPGAISVSGPRGVDVSG